MSARCMCPCAGEGLLEDEMPCDPAGHGEIETDCVSSCSSLSRTLVRSFVEIEDGYRLLWATKAP
jgi:hypothetical protein